MTIIELKNVNYQVGKQPILNNLYFGIKNGDFLTLIGPSGAGKSTIPKLIANLISPSSGTIFYHGRDIQKLDSIKYRRQVMYCFQQPVLFGKTVKDNLSFPYQIRNKEVDLARLDSILKTVDLPAEFLNKEINSLSGGEKQRVALIRSIVFLPKVLLLDEVTTGLDGKSKEIVHRLIESVHRQGTTIVQVTHDQSEIQVAKNVLEIKSRGSVNEKCNG
mgnify:FL=1